MQSDIRLRFFLVLLILQAGMVSCDWGASKLQPDEPEGPGAPIAFTPPDSNRLLRHRLGNGMAVLVLPSPGRAAQLGADRQPVKSQFVRATLRLEVGWRHDPPALPGLAFVTAHAMMATLPGSLSKLSIQASEQHSAATEFQLVVADNWTDIHFRSHSLALASTLATLRQALSDPELSDEQIQQSRLLLKQHAKSETRQNYVLRAARAALPGFDISNEASLLAVDAQSIPAAAVRRFSKEEFGSRGALLALALPGDEASPSKRRDWLDLVDPALGNWPHQPALAPVSRSTAVAADKAFFLQADDAFPEDGRFATHENSAADDVDVIAFLPGLRWDHPDMPALMVAQNLLSDSSWTLRWTGDYRSPGRFQAVSRFPLKQVVDQLSAFERQLAQADSRIEDCTKRQFIAAQQLAANQVGAQSKAIRARLTRALNLEFHGYPRNFDQTMSWAISRVQVKDVVQALERHLRPDRLQYILLGPVGDLASALQEQAPVQWIGRAPMSTVDPSSASALVPQSLEHSRGAPSLEHNQDAAGFWTQRILEVHGGTSPWQNAALFACRLERHDSSGRPPTFAQVYMESPSKLRYQASESGQTIVVAGGKSVWLPSGMNQRELSFAEHAYWAEWSMGFLPLILMDLARGESTVSELEDGAAGVQILHQGQRVYDLHCDSSGQVFELRGPSLKIGYSGFRKTDGLLLPRRMQLQTRQMKPGPNTVIATWTLTQWEINPSRKPHWFQIPSGS